MRKVKIKDVFYYLQGNIRYKLWYSRFRFLIPNHIVEQIHTRIRSMNEDCYFQGACVMCGCQTTHLQMCNKACEGDCYPSMLSRSRWNHLKFFSIASDGYIWEIKDRKFFKSYKLKQDELG